jgi:ABC transporter substrate binding protein
MVLDDRGAAIKSGLARVAADLVRRRVDLILADGLTAAQAATQATDRMPVLLLGVPGAVRHGLVQSLARPGGNATGLTIPFESLVRKQLELLRETIPQASRFGASGTPGIPSTGRQCKRRFRTRGGRWGLMSGSWGAFADSRRAGDGLLDNTPRAPQRASRAE